MKDPCEACGEDQAPPAPSCLCHPCKGCGELVTWQACAASKLDKFGEAWCPKHETEILYYMADLLLPSGSTVKAVSYDKAKELLVMHPHRPM